MNEQEEGQSFIVNDLDSGDDDTAKEPRPQQTSTPTPTGKRIYRKPKSSSNIKFEILDEEGAHPAVPDKGRDSPIGGLLGKSPSKLIPSFARFKPSTSYDRSNSMLSGSDLNLNEEDEVEVVSGSESDITDRMERTDKDRELSLSSSFREKFFSNDSSVQFTRLTGAEDDVEHGDAHDAQSFSTHSSEAKAPDMSDCSVDIRGIGTPIPGKPVTVTPPPPEILSRSGVVLLNIFFFGLSLGYLTLSVEVVPAQIEAMVGAKMKGRTLGGMVAVGAVVTFVISPLIGMVSDWGLLRHPKILRYGRRRPLMFIGSLLLFFCLFGMALSAPRINFRFSEHTPDGQCEMSDLVEKRCAPYVNKTWQAVVKDSVEGRHERLPPLGSVHHPQGANSHNFSVEGHNFELHGPEGEPLFGNLVLFIMFYLLAQSCLAVVGVAYNGLIADKASPEQRGFASGVMGGMILMGHVTGAVLGVWFDEMGVISMYLCIAMVMSTTAAATLLTTKEPPAQFNPPHLGWWGTFKAFWSPLARRDFRWVFFTRFLMQLGLTSNTAYSQYWLSDMVQLPTCWTPTRALAIMMTPLLATATLSTVPMGFLSDWLGRRKPLVIAAASLMGLMCCLMVVLSLLSGPAIYYLAIATCGVYGIGFGSYLSVDFALVLDVLPDYHLAAKDIAIWHQALVLPQALSTPIGGFLVDMFEMVNCELGLGYILLFAVTAVYFFLSAFFITRIRSAK